MWKSSGESWDPLRPAASWRIDMEEQDASFTPATITLSDDNWDTNLTLTDILFGDVHLCRYANSNIKLHATRRNL